MSLFCALGTIWAQEVTGYVLEANTKAPIPGASIYFNGSSVGSTSDLNGQFTIVFPYKTHATLIISHVGFKTKKIVDPFKGESLLITLVEDVQSIPEVVLTSDPFSRKQKLQVFKEEFLGDTRAAKYCTILNEDEVGLFFNSSSNTLSAFSNEPLLIENAYLGYLIKFEIDDFQIVFREKRLERIDNIKYTIFSGFTQFSDVVGNDKKIMERREKAYKGSAMHFMRSCWNGNWAEQNFTFKEGHKTVSSEEVVRTFEMDADYFKTISFQMKKLIVYHKKKSYYRTTLNFDGNRTFSVDRYGTFTPYRNLVFGGYMAELRVGDMLPIDYTAN